MDNAPLVTIDLANGTQWLKALDDAHLDISVALWVYLPEYEDWRFALSSRRLDEIDLPEAYGLVHDAFERAGFPLQKTPTLLILPMKNSTVRELRRIFGKAKSVEGMRLGGQMIGDRFIEDAVTFRIR